MGRTGISERIAGNCRSHLAALFTAVYYLIFNGILTVLLGRLEKKLDYFK